MWTIFSKLFDALEFWKLTWPSGQIGESECCPFVEYLEALASNRFPRQDHFHNFTASILVDSHDVCHYSYQCNISCIRRTCILAFPPIHNEQPFESRTENSKLNDAYCNIQVACNLSMRWMYVIFMQMVDKWKLSGYRWRIVIDLSAIGNRLRKINIKLIHWIYWISGLVEFEYCFTSVVGDCELSLSTNSE